MTAPKFVVAPNALDEETLWIEHTDRPVEPVCSKWEMDRYHRSLWPLILSALDSADAGERSAIPSTPAARRRELMQAIGNEECSGCREILEDDLRALSGGTGQ